ncbi:hypothetical protein QU487_02540 [Crenobacter sp. SG2305]|uniref:hypothetical protein n=1 Tax=Crenobacter oryzisoli TaxID=3056844 RepID=UPI0025AB4C16|nr:hypothetical protein [Crenobacter sp. SG2305]MDN0081639.1 hypothetical protein [Crenobacter sp. SG2305]
MNLYTRIAVQETRRMQDRIAKLNQRLPSILRGERLAEALACAGLDARIDYSHDDGVLVQLHGAIDALPLLLVTIEEASSPYGRALVRAGQADRYQLLPPGHEENGGVITVDLIGH